MLASLLVDKPMKSVGAVYNFRSSDSRATRARAIAFAHDGSLLAVGFSDGHVDLIETGRDTTVRSFPFAVPGAAMGLAFSSDSTRLLVASSTGVIAVLPGSGEYANRHHLVQMAERTLKRLRDAGLRAG